MKLLAVSVIVPVLNDAKRLESCLQAIRMGTYQGEYEFLVADNGSSDGSPDVAGSLADCVVIEERRGSYAARNAALAVAGGPILAFTDADCTPSPGWLRAGVAAIQAGADLVGGKVTFTYSRRMTAAERVDSVRNMLIEDNVRRGIAKTANLFVRREVFNAIGPFRAGLRSGGDVEWTRRATDAGFRLVYAPEAEVFHPARRLGALVAKQFRVGRGQGALWRSDGLGRSAVARRALNKMRPPGRAGVRRAIETWGPPEIQHGYTSAWLADWVRVAATGMGQLTSAVRRRH